MSAPPIGSVMVTPSTSASRKKPTTISSVGCPEITMAAPSAILTDCAAGPVTWSVLEALPAGATLNSSGQIVWTPSCGQANNYGPFTLKATAATGEIGTSSFSLVVTHKVGTVSIASISDPTVAEGAPDLGHPSPDLPEAEDAEGRTREVCADRALPGAACPQGQALRRHVTGQSEDQRPGQLRRRRRARIRAADDDVARPGRREVDREVAHAAGHEQLEPGQPLQQRRRERRPLPHDHEDLGLRDPRHEIVGIRDVLRDRGDGDAVGEARPVRERESRLLLLRAEGYSYRDIAAALELHEASVGTLIARARRAFRTLYEEPGRASD